MSANETPLRRFDGPDSSPRRFDGPDSSPRRFDGPDSSPRRFDVEIVDEVETPPKAPPVGEGERKRDYLDGFLAPPRPAATANEGEDDLKDAVIAALRDIFDPEIPVNIYDLGLIYGVEIADGHAIVTMTLTTPHCPVAESMPGEVEIRVMSVPGIATCDVNLVWDPPWNPASMSDEARLELGML